MTSRRTFLGSLAFSRVLCGISFRAEHAAKPLDPRGRAHIPIGIPNTLDALKTFAEAEGSFSPGFGTYGVYFWVYDRVSQGLIAPTMDGVPCSFGLHELGFLIPWSEWKAGPLRIRSELCHTQHKVGEDNVQIVAAHVQLFNTGSRSQRFIFYAAVRPLGPAGYDITDMGISSNGDAILVGKRVALLAAQPPSGGGTLGEDTIGESAMGGQTPVEQVSHSPAGNCSGALLFDVDLAPSEFRWLGFVCPVLAGRRAARHHWVDLKQGAMVDTAQLYPPKRGILQPDPGLNYYRGLSVPGLFRQAISDWRELTGSLNISTPDRRWEASARAIVGHLSLCMDEGGPEAAVINYNVFNRDGVYITNVFQKAGLFSLAEIALDYFLKHPFSGRPYPEADNPGEILWALGQQWLFARDENWLERIYPSAAKIASMIEYYRTTPAPHWVNATSLTFGEALPKDLRSELKAGRCDGYHPEYTQAFDVAGLRAATVLARVAGKPQDARRWSALSQSLFGVYDNRFGKDLAHGYGSYSVLWPCRVYPLSSAKARKQFQSIGPQKPEHWRYLPLATAHQGLLAGNRDAACGTLATSLDDEQMRGWFAFDEGGGSASGTWYRARTTWPCCKSKPGDNLGVAMPHGWAIAEFWLLMRDAIVYEDGGRLILLAGIAPEWFRHSAGIRAENLPTHFGPFSFKYSPGKRFATLTLTGSAQPTQGYALHLPVDLAGGVSADGLNLGAGHDGNWNLPGDTRKITIKFRSGPKIAKMPEHPADVFR
jgi:hypothetical protein